MSTFDVSTRLTGRWKTRTCAALLLAVTAIAGCEGIEPFEPPNHREEGSGRGLFTGSEGEFVILRVQEEKEPGEDSAKEAEDGKQAQPQK